MKTHFLSLAGFLLLMSPGFIQAQKDFTPFNRINIPYGQKPPAPVIHQKDEGFQNMYNSKKHDLSNYTADAEKGIKTSLNFHLTKDINNIPGGSSNAMPSAITPKEESVIVVAYTPATGYELYKSDGSEAGTVLVNDIYPGPNSSNPEVFVSQNGLNYFVANNGIGSALYSSDGQPGGLKRLSEYLGVNSYVKNLNICDNGQLFYIIHKYTNGLNELWHSNGTETGGELLASNLYYYDYYTAIVGNTAFFVAGDYEHGWELWKSDGTPSGTKLVKDINPGVKDSYPYSLFAYKNNLFFGAFNGVDYSFWRTDGTASGTIIVKNIAPDYYDYEEEPWSKVSCISNGILYFFGIDVAKRVMGLWKSNGNEAGTELVKTVGLYPQAYPHYLTDVKGTLFFTCADSLRGEGLWKTGGQPKNTVYVKEIGIGGAGQDYYNYYLCSIDRIVYFVNYSTSTIWSSDGTTENTKEIISDAFNGLYWFRNLTPAGSKLFFSAYSPDYGQELFVGEPIDNKMQVSTLSSSPIKVEKNDAVFDVTLYPNPTHDNAVLKVGGNTKKVTVSITDIAGKVLWKMSFNGQRTINLPLQKISSGTYLVTVKNDKESKSLKVVKE